MVFMSGEYIADMVVKVCVKDVQGIVVSAVVVDVENCRSSCHRFYLYCCDVVSTRDFDGAPGICVERGVDEDDGSRAAAVR